MNLRLHVSLTDFRQIDVTIGDDLAPGELQRLARIIAEQVFGRHGLVVVQCVEEIAAWTTEEEEEVWIG